MAKRAETADRAAVKELSIANKPLSAMRSRVSGDPEESEPGQEGST